MTEAVENLKDGLASWVDDEAREVISLAEQKARELGHTHVGTEHLVLGMLQLSSCTAARVLYELDITIDRFRSQVVRIMGGEDEAFGGFTPDFTPRVKKVLGLALREALSLHKGATPCKIRTEHILLGIVRENNGVASRVLLDFDADPEKVRNKVIRALSISREMSTARASFATVKALVQGDTLSDDQLAELQKELGQISLMVAERRRRAMI